jgi:hypothetical protein
MRRCVDKVREAGQRSREANCRAIERNDKDLGMRIKGMCDKQVAGNEATESCSLKIGILFLLSAAAIDVGAAGNDQLLRAGRIQETAYAEKNRPLPVRTVMEISGSFATSTSVFASW